MWAPLTIFFVTVVTVSISVFAITFFHVIEGLIGNGNSFTEECCPWIFYIHFLSGVTTTTVPITPTKQTPTPDTTHTTKAVTKFASDTVSLVFIFNDYFSESPHKFPVFSVSSISVPQAAHVEYECNNTRKTNKY